MNEIETLKEHSAGRYIGLDVHKHYLIALGVDENLQVVMRARRVELSTPGELDEKDISRRQDEVVLEMTTNTWHLYDELLEYVGFSQGRASTARSIDDTVAGYDRQDRRFDPGAPIGERIAGGDLGAAAGSARIARTGGAAPKNDTPGNASQEPSACGHSKTSPAAARRESLCENEQWLVGGVATGEGWKR